MNIPKTWRLRIKLTVMAFVAFSFGWPTLKFVYEMNDTVLGQWNEPGFNRGIALLVLACAILVLGICLYIAYRFVIGLADYIAGSSSPKHRQSSPN